MKLIGLLSFFICFLSFSKEATNFKLKGHDGNIYELSQFKGKTVVLEWFNHGCPFVRKHYDTNNMQELQKKYVGKDTVWFSINSSNIGKQGYLKNEKAANKIYLQEGMKSTALLIDTDGKIGQAYGAVTTPHIFIINKKGKLIYQGAIDNNPSTQMGKADINYIDKTFTRMANKKTERYETTKAYGCSVKY
jgi:peroxiredoxin